MSDLLNKKYSVELEVLTPLHIGAGSEKEWMKGADYISDNGKVYILNHKKLLKNLKGGADELSNFLLKKDDRGLRNKISGSLEDVSDIVFKSPTGSENDIKTFIKNGLTNKPIVPGSSVKGAIRSILFSYLKEKHQNNEQIIFGTANRGDEFMRFIKIADAQFESSELINTKIFNLYKDSSEFKGGWKKSGNRTNPDYEANGFNTIYEVIKPTKTGELSIAYSKKAFNSFIKENRKVDNPVKIAKEKEKKEILESDDLNILFSIINTHTNAYIKKQIAFFDKYSNNETDNIINNLEKIKDRIPKDNTSCILKMSAGSGFHSITGDWQFDNFSINGVAGGRVSRGQLNRNDSAKSRKIAIDNDNFYLMGFVKLTLLSEELIAQREQERKAKLEEEQRIEAERIAAEKAEQERIEKERLAKIEAERKAEEERIAKEKAKQEERERHEREQRELLLKKQEENKKKRTIEAEKVISEGLKSIDKIDDFNSGKPKIEIYFKALKGNLILDDIQVDLLKKFIQRCIAKSSKRWKKAGKQDWVLVKKWVGQETAQQWFNELIKK